METRHRLTAIALSRMAWQRHTLFLSLQIKEARKGIVQRSVDKGGNQSTAKKQSRRDREWKGEER